MKNNVGKFVLLSLLVLAQMHLFNGYADHLEKLRTTKKIIPVAEPSAPWFAVQILALKLPPTNPGFFSNVEVAYEYACTDGFVRYNVGPYPSYEAARADLARVRALGYEGAFVVDVRNYELVPDAGAAYRFDETGDTPPDSRQVYTVQLAAMRYPVYLSHFPQFTDVMEFYLTDKIYRYCVGKYKGDEALEALARVRSMGYPNAYLVLLDHYLPFQIE